MAQLKERTAQIVKQYARKEGDTGRNCLTQAQRIAAFAGRVCQHLKRNQCKKARGQ